MNEQILIYLFCADMSMQLNNILNMKRQMLKGKMGDIMLSAEIKRIQNDIAELNRVASSTVNPCIEILSKNYGCKFQFIIPQENKPSGVDGKEIKLTP